MCPLRKFNGADTLRSNGSYTFPPICGETSFPVPSEL